MKASELIKTLQKFVDDSGDKDIYIGNFCDCCDDNSDDFEKNYIKDIDVRFIDDDYLHHPDSSYCNNLIGFCIVEPVWS